MNNNRKKVLIAEDACTMREYYKMWFKAYFPNCDITLACNGSHAVKLMENIDCFDLIISDVEMPIMDGIEFYNNVQESSKNNVPFVFVTSNEYKVRDLLPEEYCPDIFSKPLMEGLKGKISHILSRPTPPISPNAGVAIKRTCD